MRQAVVCSHHNMTPTGQSLVYEDLNNKHHNALSAGSGSCHVAKPAMKHVAAWASHKTHLLYARNPGKGVFRAL